MVVALVLLLVFLGIPAIYCVILMIIDILYWLEERKKYKNTPPPRE